MFLLAIVSHIAEERQIIGHTQSLTRFAEEVQNHLIEVVLERVLYLDGLANRVLDLGKETLQHDRKVSLEAFRLQGGPRQMHDKDFPLVVPIIAVGKHQTISKRSKRGEMYL